MHICSDNKGGNGDGKITKDREIRIIKIRFRWHADFTENCTFKVRRKISLKRQSLKVADGDL